MLLLRRVRAIAMVVSDRNGKRWRPPTTIINCANIFTAVVTMETVRGFSFKGDTVCMPMYFRFSRNSGRDRAALRAEVSGRNLMLLLDGQVIRKLLWGRA